MGLNRVEMDAKHLVVGMPITLIPLRRYDYEVHVRIEAIGYDWVLCRTVSGIPDHDEYVFLLEYVDDIAAEGHVGDELYS